MFIKAYLFFLPFQASLRVFYCPFPSCSESIIILSYDNSLLSWLYHFQNFIWELT